MCVEARYRHLRPSIPIKTGLNLCLEIRKNFRLGRPQHWWMCPRKRLLRPVWDFRWGELGSPGQSAKGHGWTDWHQGCQCCISSVGDGKWQHGEGKMAVSHLQNHWLVANQLTQRVLGCEDEEKYEPINAGVLGRWTRFRLFSALDVDKRSSSRNIFCRDSCMNHLTSLSLMLRRRRKRDSPNSLKRMRRSKRQRRSSCGAFRGLRRLWPATILSSSLSFSLLWIVAQWLHRLNS